MKEEELKKVIEEKYSINKIDDNFVLIEYKGNSGIGRVVCTLNKDMEYFLIKEYQAGQLAERERCLKMINEIRLKYRDLKSGEQQEVCEELTKKVSEEK